jgi:hypothetical protein
MKTTKSPKKRKIKIKSIMSVDFDRDYVIEIILEKNNKINPHIWK